LEADFALLNSVGTSRSSPHESKAGERHRCSFVAGLIYCQTQVAVVCNISQNDPNTYTFDAINLLINYNISHNTFYPSVNVNISAIL